MIDVTCPQCGEVYHAAAVHVGKRIRCTKCGSLLPILGAGGTIVQKPPEANEIRSSRSTVEHGAARHRPRRTSFGLGLAIIAVGLLILWRHTNTQTGAGPRSHNESQTSPQAGAATREPSINPDGSQMLGGTPRIPQEPNVANIDQFVAEKQAETPAPAEAGKSGATLIPREPDFSDVDQFVKGTTNEKPSHAAPIGGQNRAALPCNNQDLTNPRSMPNGSQITPDVSASGYGVLEVQNGTSEDAVLSLYDSADNERVREVYVKARHTVRMKGIPKGTYELAYTHGLDWVSDDIFRCGDQDYAHFERQFDFTEDKDQEGVQYKTITVTLHPVVGGNVRTKKISRQEFLRTHRRIAILSR